MSIYLKTGRVKSEWTDYNGHMNVAFYTMAIDKSLDFFLENNRFFKAIFSAISNTADISSMGKNDDPWYKQAKDNKRKIGTDQPQPWQN